MSPRQEECTVRRIVARLERAKRRLQQQTVELHELGGKRWRPRTVEETEVIIRDIIHAEERLAREFPHIVLKHSPGGISWSRKEPDAAEVPVV